MREAVTASLPPAIRRELDRIAARAQDAATSEALRALPQLDELRQALARLIEVHGYRGLAVIDPSGRIVADR